MSPFPFVPVRLVLPAIAVCLLASRAYAQPANDNPCNAISLPVNASCVTTNGTVQNATASGVATPSCGNGNSDVWYTAVVPASGMLTVTTAPGSSNALNNGGMAFYTVGNCATVASFTEIACNDDQSFFNLMPKISVSCRTPGTVIYIRVWKQSGGSSARNFTICATSTGGSVNDEPCCATLLNVTTNCSFTASTNVGASYSTGIPAPGCGGFATGDPDVWFTFTAPASGIAIIETQAGTMTDGAMALYSAPSCSGPFSLVQCGDDANTSLMPLLTFTGLTPGATYYLRVWDYYGGTGTFSVCVHGPATIPAGQCVYMLQMFDSNDNGWGSSSVGISINGGPFTTYTVTNSYNIALIGVNVGNIIAVQYNAVGGGQGQNSYNLSLLTGGGLIFTSGSPPAAGIVFTQTVTCQPPPAPANDCAGGSTVCGSQSFNNNSSGTGNVADLNASNEGCLASGERQGTWYRFSPSAGGTVGFTLSPSVTSTDYDFAVWGPMSSVQCPPSGPPVRCSYSALTGNTGLGNGAVDNSEGAGGDKWVSLLTVTAGQIYILYIDNFSANGQSFSLSWQLGAGASLNCTVLPIELVDISARAVGDGIDVRWTTASEVNNDRFEVERSADGEDFKFIGSLPGAGNSSQSLSYLFTDQAPLRGVNYYRLRQVDTDGAEMFSPVRSAYYAGGLQEIMIFPNPGSGAVSVLLPNGRADMPLLIFDATGREVKRVQHVSAQVDLDLSWLPRGVYTFCAADEGGNVLARQRWIKQ